jgi:hypothetical protein
VITAAVRELRELTQSPVGGYANVGHVDEEVGWAPTNGSQVIGMPNTPEHGSI